MGKYLYCESHEWLLIDGTKAKIGISEYAANELGDVVFVDLPEVGAEIQCGKAFCEVESVKAVSEINAPACGTIVAVNASLEDAPEKLNETPKENWICEIELADSFKADKLMDEDAYAAYVATL